MLRTLDHRAAEFFRRFARLQEGRDEGIAVFRNSESVHPEAGSDGMPVAEIYGKTEVSQVIYFNWKGECGELLPMKMCRLRC